MASPAVNPDDGVEGFARAPFAIATDVQLDGVWASNAPGVDAASPAALRLRDRRAAHPLDIPRRGRDRHDRVARLLPPTGPGPRGVRDHGPGRPRRRCRHRRRHRPGRRPGVAATRMRNPRIKGRMKGSTAAYDGTRRAISRRSAWPTPRRSVATPARNGKRRRVMNEAGSRRRTECRARAGPSLSADPHLRIRARAFHTPSRTSRPAASPLWRATGLDRLRDDEPLDLERAVEGPHHDRRSRRAVAGDHGREHLLPAQLRPCFIAGEHVAVRPRRTGPTTTTTTAT